MVQSPGDVRQKSVGCLGTGIDGVHDGGGDPVVVLLVDRLRHHEVAAALRLSSCRMSETREHEVDQLE